MNKKFIRAVWGNGFETGEEAFRGGKLYNDIKSVVDNPYEPDFVCYVFGEENLNRLKELNVDCRLVNSEPVIWDMEKELYRHKLEAIDLAMHDYDEIVFLDWDCNAIKNIPDFIWDELAKKESFQAPLMSYRTKKCLWREEDIRKVPNAGFVYMRDKTIPQKLIHIWEDFGRYLEKRGEEKRKVKFREQCLVFQEEPAMAKYIDDIMGGWPGIDKYFDLFEPMVCNLSSKSAYTEEKLKLKNTYFFH